MVYIGIDPGQSGGIAILWPQGPQTFKMPDTESALFKIFEKFDPYKGDDAAVAMIENVHASPQMGRTSAFTFGKGYGALRMALAGNRIAFDAISPQRWQKAMDCRLGGKGFGERNATEAKNVTKRRAAELFPAMTITHAIADCLLIAEYCRRYHEGLLA